MAEIIMPKMGDAMTEGKVVRWYKKAGEGVRKGEPVLEIETDKVNLDLEAEQDGVIGEVAVGEGETVEVGSVLATIVAEGESARPKPREERKATTRKQQREKEEEKPSEKRDRKKTAEEEPEEESAAAEEADSPADDASSDEEPDRHDDSSGKKKREAPAPEARARGEEAAKADDGRRVRSSPLARRMARELGVDLEGVRGSGPSGRIVAADVDSASKAGGRPAAGQRQASTPASSEAKTPALPPKKKLERREVPLSAMRRTIAKRLVESTGPIPHFYLTVDYDVTELLRLRTQLNEIHSSRVSVNDFIVRAVALALLHHPNINATFQPEAIVEHGNAHVGIAVATPEGLITPVVRDADGKSVVEIAEEVRDLAARAKNRKLKPDEYQGSTITISNLGMFGIEEFTAIINPPNSAIFAVGAASQQPVVIDGQIVVRDRMKVTMSCDHRVIDGAAGAEYLRTLRTYIEQPLRLVM